MEIKISSEVLGSLMPQRSMLNAAKVDLDKHTFELVEQLDPREGDDVPADLETKSPNSGQVRFRFKNVKTHKTLVLSARQLVFMNAYDSKTAAALKTAGDKDPGKPLHEIMTEVMRGKDSESIIIPKKLTIIGVEELQREDANGRMTSVYPSYMYQKFEDRARGLNDAQRFELYRDFELMRSLPGSDPSPRYAKAEKIKDLKVHFYMEEA